MKRLCNKQCFKCKYSDCINDGPPSFKEIQIIESHSRFVRDVYGTDDNPLPKKKKTHKYNREYYMKYRKTHKGDYARRLKEWRERMKEGNVNA